MALPFIVSLGLNGKEWVVEQEILIRVQMMMAHAFVMSFLTLYLFETFFVSKFGFYDKWAMPALLIAGMVLYWIPEVSLLYCRCFVVTSAFWISVLWSFRGIRKILGLRKQG